MRSTNDVRTALVGISAVAGLFAAACSKPSAGSGDGDTDILEQVVESCEDVTLACPPGLSSLVESSAQYETFEVIGEVGGVGMVPLAGTIGGGKVNVALERTIGECRYLCVPPPCWGETKTACFAATCFVCATPDPASLEICQSCTDQGLAATDGAATADGE